MGDDIYELINKLKQEEAKKFAENFEFNLKVDEYVESLHNFLFELKEKGKLNKKEWDRAVSLIRRGQKLKS